MDEKLDRFGRTEAEAVAAYQAKSYPKPALTADIALFAHDGEQLKVLLIRRGNHPYLDCWALPGGFANPNEPVLHTAFRELQEETGIKCDSMQLVGVYSKPGRDPRGWVVSVAYTAYLENGCENVCGADDAAEAKWINIQFDDEQPVVFLPDGGKLAFDHDAIIKDAISRNTMTASAKEILNCFEKRNVMDDD